MSQIREQQALEAVRAQLARLGLGAREASEDSSAGPYRWQPALIAEGAAGRWVVEVKSVRPFRSRSLLGSLALALLQVRRYADSHGGRALVAIVLPRVTGRARAEVEEFVAELAGGDVDWLLVGERGDAAWSLGGVAGERPATGVHDGPARRDDATMRVNAFTPGFQRLLKLLLLRGFPQRLARGPTSPPSNLSELARLGGVVPSYASHFASVMRRLGYLEYERRRFVFRDTHRLLLDWAAFLRAAPDPTTRAVPLYPTGNADPYSDIADRLRMGPDVSGPPSAAFTGHAAARVLGLSHSSATSVGIVVRGEFEAALRDLELVPAVGPNTVPAVTVAVPRAPESVFASAVTIDGMPATDVLQCYLDLQGRPGRGDEQARSIFDRVLVRYLPGLK